jgi:hypothetical protein
MDVLMKCGHTAQGRESKTGKPVCVICFPKPEASMPEENIPNLEGRMAECCYARGRDGKPCRKKVPSSFDLAFFEHRPDQETDLYYCGCWGWD